MYKLKSLVFLLATILISCTNEKSKICSNTRWVEIKNLKTTLEVVKGKTISKEYDCIYNKYSDRFDCSNDDEKLAISMDHPPLIYQGDLYKNETSYLLTVINVLDGYIRSEPSKQYSNIEENPNTSCTENKVTKTVTLKGSTNKYIPEDVRFKLNYISLYMPVVEKPGFEL